MPNPTCPTCSGPMLTRTSAHGKFYSCRSFPRCKGTRRIGDAGGTDMGDTAAKTPQPRHGAGKGLGASVMQGMVIARKVPEVAGSAEQLAIWEAVLDEGGGHAMIQARAGTGKSFTIFHAACRADPSLAVGVVAYNKPIAGEMEGRFTAAGAANCKAATFHRLGFSAIRRAYGNVQISKYKMANIAEFLLPAGACEADKLDEARGNLAKLAGLVKNYMANPLDILLLAELADKHNIELGTGGEAGLVLGLAGAAISASWDQRDRVVDFDDMLYVPVRGGLRPDQFDLLLVDEAQDVNQVQIELALMAVKAGGRMVIVGDKFQAIYGFRGAHSGAMQEMASRLWHGHGQIAESNVVDYPLTVTRRCGRHIVRLAQCLVPDIAALPDAAEGVIRECVKWDRAVGEMAAGDMVLCRVNRYLIPVAYALLRRGVKAVIRGRDIGANVTALMGKVLRTEEGGCKGSKGAQDAATVGQLLTALTSYREREEERLTALGRNGAGRLESLTDQCDTLAELCEGCATVAEVKGKVAQLFADFDPAGQPNNAVVCSTIHGAKGLEAERVYVLNTELLPHPRAVRDWEREQERNLIYVAVTRAKRELAFVAGKAGQWKGGDGAVPLCLREGMRAIAAEKGEAERKQLTGILEQEYAGGESLATLADEQEAADEEWLRRREMEQ